MVCIIQIYLSFICLFIFLFIIFSDKFYCSKLLGRFFLALETKGILSNHLDPLQIVVVTYYHDQRRTSTIDFLYHLDI